MVQNLELTPLDSVILAFCQLIQPVTCAAAFEAFQRQQIADGIDAKFFNKRFSFLDDAGYIWRCNDRKEYILTPRGYEISMHSIEPKTRDKLRLIFLNNNLTGK